MKRNLPILTLLAMALLSCRQASSPAPGGPVGAVRFLYTGDVGGALDPCG